MEEMIFILSFRGCWGFIIYSYKYVRYIWIILNRIIGRDIGYMKEIVEYWIRNVVRNSVVFSLVNDDISLLWKKYY